MGDLPCLACFSEPVLDVLCVISREERSDATLRRAPFGKPQTKGACLRGEIFKIQIFLFLPGERLFFPRLHIISAYYF